MINIAIIICFWELGKNLAMMILPKKYHEDDNWSLSERDILEGLINSIRENEHLLSYGSVFEDIHPVAKANDNAMFEAITGSKKKVIKRKKTKTK